MKSKKPCWSNKIWP